MSLSKPDGIDIGTPEAWTPAADGVKAQLEKIRSALYDSFANILSLVLALHDGEWTSDGAVVLAYYEDLLNQRFKNNIEEVDSMAMQAMALLALRGRFAANPGLHTGCNWNRVEAALINNKPALNALVKMELAGHEPNVYNFDNEGFDIGTCSPESPLSGRNCVYDAQAAADLIRQYPDSQFNGNAVEQAKEMGIGLITQPQYNLLQAKGQFDTFFHSHIWLTTPDDTRTNTNQAYYGGRNGFDDVFSRFKYAYFSSVIMGWRGSLRVPWVKT